MNLYNLVFAFNRLIIVFRIAESGFSLPSQILADRYDAPLSYQHLLINAPKRMGMLSIFAEREVPFSTRHFQAPHELISQQPAIDSLYCDRAISQAM